MGLEMVEFIMAVEEHFRIKIPDADAANFRTPRQVIQYVSSQLLLINAPVPCRTQQAFYRLRRALVDECGANRSSVHPATALDEIIPAAEARQPAWASLKVRLAATDWPSLRRPDWLARAIVYGTASLAALAFVVPAWGPEPPGISRTALCGVILCIAACLSALSMRATQPLAGATPYQYTTVASLAQLLVGQSIPHGRDGQSEWARGDVESAVRWLITKELGATNYADHADFIRDMGVD